MKKIFIALTLLVFMASACNQNRPQQNNVTIENNTTAGFDVNKLAQFVKTSTDPATLHALFTAAGAEPVVPPSRNPSY